MMRTAARRGAGGMTALLGALSGRLTSGSGAARECASQSRATHSALAAAAAAGEGGGGASGAGGATSTAPSGGVGHALGTVLGGAAVVAGGAVAYVGAMLDLDGVLVKSDWTRERGWRTFKRPGVEAFLKHMSQYYELVVYTEQLATYGEPILERLDPQRFISYRLYRDATRYTKGTHCRDLSQLNRPLERVLFITTDPKAAQLQPDNALLIPAWDLNAQDTQLLDLLPFLESVVRRNVADSRVVLSSYAQEAGATGKDVATIFRERSAKMQQFLQQREKAPRTLFGARAAAKT